MRIKKGKEGEGREGKESQEEVVSGFDYGGIKK